MSKVWIAVLAGAAGVGLGLLIAKEYARDQVGDEIDKAGAAIGLPSSVTGAIKGFIVSNTVG